MWTCSKCEQRNPDNQNYCPVCGTVKPIVKPRDITPNSNSIPQKAKWYQRPWFYITVILVSLGAGILGYHFVQQSKIGQSCESLLQAAIGNHGTDNATAQKNDAVNFADENFESVIRQLINKPEGTILKSDVEAITEINAFNCGINDISGIENMINLEVLEISDNHITDISDIAELRKLKELYLSDNGLSNIDAVKALTNLRILSIEGNEIKDVSALERLSNLTTLYLKNNPISEYSPLKGILDHLEFYDFSIPDSKDGNSKNGGIFALSDGNVVFGGNKLYLMNESLSVVSEISEDIGATDINIQDGWIYYCKGWDGTNKSADSYLSLYKVKVDGTDRQLLSRDECISVQIYGDYIYYSNRDDNFSIYRIRTNGEGREKLNSYDSIDLCVADSGIYYINRADGNSIYQIPLAGGEGYKLGEVACKSLQIYNNSLYFIGEDDGCIYSLSLEQGLIMVNNDSCEVFNISDGWIYYSNNSDGGRLYKARLDGSDKQKLSDEETCHTIHVIGDYVIYAYSTRDNSGNWVWHGYYMMKKDGSEKQDLPDKQDIFAVKNNILNKYIGSGKLVIIPGYITQIGDQAFNPSELVTVTIPGSVTSIGNYAFYNCPYLVSLNMLDGVKIIKSNAFSDAVSLTSLSIPNSVTRIEEGAFFDCPSLTSLTFGDSLQFIGDNAFSLCTGLTSVILPDSLKQIGNWAFMNCSSLTNIYIPDSVTSIGKDAFSKCEQVKIFGKSGSYAEKYAMSNDLEFVVQESGLVTFNGHWYQLSSESCMWEEAKKSCEDAGGYLATITSQGEMDTVSNIISHSGYGKVIVWIGGTDQKDEGDWEWISGEEFDYTNWKSEFEPNNYNNEDYLQIDENPGWNDANGQQLCYYLIEWNTKPDIVNWLR